MFGDFCGQLKKRIASIFVIFHIGAILLKNIALVLKVCCTVSELQQYDFWSKSIWELVDQVKNFVAEKVREIPIPEASIEDVELRDVSLESVTFIAKVSVTNPYIVPIPICTTSYILKSDNRVIASGTIPDPGLLKGNGTTMLDVGINVPYSVLMSLAIDIGADWDIDYDLDLDFIFALPLIGNVIVPVSITDKIHLPTFSDLFKWVEL